MPQLKVLSMSHNQLYTIDFIGEPLFGLKIISLRNNDIIDLPRLLYMNVTSLTELDLSGNKLTEFSKGTLAFNNITILKLARSNLNMSLSPDLFMSAPKLKKLTISQNLLENIAVSFLRSLPSETVINIASEYIIILHFPPDTTLSIAIATYCTC